MKQLLFFVSLTISSFAFGQFNTPRVSPPCTVRQEAGFTTIEVYYERPAARGRTEEEIFGKLVPWGKVWRTGAGPATLITFSTAVWIDNTEVPARTYALFTIPGIEEWTVMLNRDTAAYAFGHYDPANDAVRFTVKPARCERYHESVTIDIDFVPNNARIYISWLNTQISFDVNTGTDEAVMKYIREQLLANKSTMADDYDKAVEYYRWNNLDLDQAMKLVARGIELHNSRYWYYHKIRILQKQGKYTEAIAAARDGIRFLETAPEEPGLEKKYLIRDLEEMIKEIRQSETDSGRKKSPQ